MDKVGFQTSFEKTEHITSIKNSPKPNLVENSLSMNLNTQNKLYNGLDHCGMNRKLNFTFQLTRIGAY